MRCSSSAAEAGPRTQRPPAAPRARYHAPVGRTTSCRGLPHRAAWPLLGLGLASCVEIDPSYADAFTTTATSGASSSATATADDPSTTDDPTSPPGECDCAPLELCEAGACTQPARVLYVSLDGATTTFGNADASQDVQGLYEELAGTWDPYGGDAAARELLLATIAEQWAAYRVVVTDERPPAGPYLMAVVTATPPPAIFDPSVAYVAYPDCGEVIAQDVSFVFATPGDGSDAAHASWVSAAFGRGLGLRYNDASDDIMGFGNRFVDTCYPSPEPACAAHHPELCSDDPMQQSSHGELLALLGARG